MEDSELLNKSDAQPRRLSLIDVSCEDDSLIDSFTGDFKFSDDQVNQSLELFGGAAANKLDAVPENVELNEQVIEPSESMEPVVTKKRGKYNLRESIAWNSAFLTGPGVLDAEELSSMIDGDKSETKMLPGIQEEVYRSTDTISTLESDTLTLESVEANLFEDVRASIQRSSNTSKVADESIKVGSGVAEDRSICDVPFDLTQPCFFSASKGMNFASQDKARPRLASKKTSIDVQKPGILKRQASRCTQVSQSVSTSGGSSKSLLKRPKVLGNPNPSLVALTKRASMGGALVKVEKDTVKSTTGRGAPVSKAALSSRIVPKPRPSTKTSHLGASLATRREATSSSIDSSGSTTSRNISKSPLNSRRKTDSRTDNTLSSGPTFKTSPRSGKSLLSSNMMPVSKLLSNISPATSVSEWSSESSRASLDTISLKSGSVDFDTPLILDLQNHGKDLSSVGHETQATGLLRRSVVNAPMERNGALPPTSKPSGLRLPSPKIGFFDGVKSAGSTPNGKKQSHPLVPSSSPKFGTGPVGLSGGQSKGKMGKLQPARTVTKEGSKKPDTQLSQQMASNMKPKSSVPVQNSSNAAKKVLTPSRKSISPKVDSKVNPKSGTENQLKDEKKGSEGHGIDIKEKQNCFAEKKTSVVISEDQVNPELKGSPLKAAKVTPIEGESTSLCESISTSDANVIIASEEVGKEPHSVMHDSDSLNVHKERKELEIEEQIHDVSRQVGALDISAEAQQMLVCESLRPHSVKHDSDSLYVFKERKESQIEEQVHDLSRQVGATDISTETQQILIG